VQVDVILLLPGRFAVGEEEVHALAPQARCPQARRRRVSDSEHLRAVLRIEIGHASRVGARDHEHVSGFNRLDVHDRRRALVFVDDAHVITPGDQTAEQTLRVRDHRVAGSGVERRVCLGRQPGSESRARTSGAG
jgi:hypothetical protein